MDRREFLRRGLSTAATLVLGVKPAAGFACSIFVDPGSLSVPEFIFAKPMRLDLGLVKPEIVYSSIDRANFERVKAIMSNVRWQYGPPREVTQIPAEGGGDGPT